MNEPTNNLSLTVFPIHYQTNVYKLDHLNMYYLEVPQEIVNQLGGLKCGRLICDVNSVLKFQCGLMALGSGRAYISINSKRMKELHLNLGDPVTITLEKDNSEFGTEMPEELKELFMQDEAGKMRFDKLKPGMKRYIVQYVAGVRNSQLRINRAILLIENLKSLPEGKETFRQMLGKK